MSQIKIDTGIIRQAADDMGQINERMLNAFDPLEQAVSGMNCVCCGTAIDRTVGALREMKNVYTIPLHDRFAQFVNLLQSQISAGYEMTENTVSSLADEFD